MERENLGPAERLIQTLLTYSDHMYHNRPGVVTQAPASPTGLAWQPVTHKVEKVGEVEQTNVYKLEKVKAGKKERTIKTLLGQMSADRTVRLNGTKVGEYRAAGMFPEVATWMYKQIADVWKLDNEFAARWASYAFADKGTSRDMKVALAAFMLCQSRKGEAVFDAGKIAFFDDDFRNVGEAMLLLPGDFDIKLLIRVREVLELPGVAALNRELGFGRSARSSHLGRWPGVATKWLLYREQNPKVLAGLLKAGFRKTLLKLVRMVGYMPMSAEFFKTLRWKQAQSKQGHRDFAIGEAVKVAETWADLTEEQVCERIMREKPTFKRIVGMVPNGLTRAIVTAAVEAGAFSDKDLIIFTPTLEELGLLKVQEVRERLEKALARAEDQRAANIARNVKSKDLKELLQQGADNAMAAAVEEATKGIFVYFMVDISGSMEGAIPQAVQYITKLLGGFPLEKVRISTFTTTGREVVVKAASAVGVTQAFRGISAGGGTDYGAGIRILQKYKPDPGDDALFMFVGDEAHARPNFVEAVQASGLNPRAFGLVPVATALGRGRAVRDTATLLGIPCFEIGPDTFADPYAIPKTVRALIASTPVGTTHATAPARVTLIDQIMKTDLLKKPVWADAPSA